MTETTARCAPECSCKVGDDCTSRACCYYGCIIPTNAHTALDPGPSPVTEKERLRAAVEYCRMRLKRDCYRDTLDAILRGDKDESIRNPDMTEMVASCAMIRTRPPPSVKNWIVCQPAPSAWTKDLKCEHPGCKAPARQGYAYGTTRAYWRLCLDHQEELTRSVLS